MLSIIIFLLKATVGLLFDKARDLVVEKLRDGDVVDQKIRNIIAREIKDVKSKLDALSRRDLLAAIDAFETGVRYLYKAVDTDVATRSAQRADEEQLRDAVSLPTSPPRAPVNSVVLTAGMRNMELKEFRGEAKRALSQGKERFKMAREKATDAFNNKSLSTLDRIIAIRCRVIAAMLESAVEILGKESELSSVSVKSALKGALPECEQCLWQLHSLPDVKNNFKVELKKSPPNIKGRFKKEERREIISAVWQVNRAINDVLQETGAGNIDICYYPTIDIGDEKIDPLLDERVAEVLQKLGIEDKSSIGWPIGEDGEDNHKLKNAISIATNADGEFIIADNYGTVKVFDNTGKFIYKFYPYVQANDASTRLLAVATDENKNTYVLVVLDGIRSEVQVFKRADLLINFRLQRAAELHSKLTVGNGKVLVSINEEMPPVVDVYDLNGRYETAVGNGILQDASDIAVGPGGQIFVLDSRQKLCIIFNEDGRKEHQFTVCRELEESADPCRLALHPSGEFIFFAVVHWFTYRLAVELYTNDGVFNRRINLHAMPPFAISKDGRLAVTQHKHGGANVIVL